MVLIKGCQEGDRQSQRLLYKHYFAYCMSICVRYSQSEEEAKEILNDAFIKAFNKIGQYDTSKPFKAWIRRIMINTAIDHFRSNKKHYYHSDIDDGYDEAVEANVVGDLSYEEILLLVQRLSPVYQAVFSLYVIDGYSHENISKKLGISVGTSKSNLSKARANLKKMLMKTSKEVYEQYI
ncbi:RNA polymerase sigma factor [Fulvivirga sp. M361]|uniref:RNA polymerase sigma factor n=1 Tax=Fulvivirga sp. M361 TaxID=2594266 RepID=UPI001179EA3E|nr:RNA polymerase sigma factor [Fulvivirga sp. M361]TRX62019.1 RNA polymerase sigma factor [Fulvivirga sp. M361]